MFVSLVTWNCKKYYFTYLLYIDRGEEKKKKTKKKEERREERRRDFIY
jgi:hypothetical protein